MALTLEFDDTQQGALFDLLGIPTGTDVTVDALRAKQEEAAA